MTELWRLPATELAQLVRTREVSAREAAESALKRLDAVNPKINAIVAHRPDLVREQADRVDQMVARGEDPGPLVRILTGAQYRSAADVRYRPDRPHSGRSARRSYGNVGS